MITEKKFRMMKLRKFFKIHWFCWIYFFIALLSGYIKYFLISLSIVIIHELSHLWMASFYKFKVDVPFLKAWHGRNESIEAVYDN